MTDHDLNYRDALALKFEERLDRVVGADINRLKHQLEQELNLPKEKTQRIAAAYQAFGSYQSLLEQVGRDNDMKPPKKSESLIADIYRKIESDLELTQTMPSKLFRQGWLAKVFNDIASQ